MVGVCSLVFVLGATPIAPLGAVALSTAGVVARPYDPRSRYGMGGPINSPYDGFRTLALI